MPHLVLFFLLSEWNKRWWKAATALESLLLSRLHLNLAVARGSLQICCLLFLSPCHPPTLCLSSLSLSSPHNRAVCHFCLMCPKWIKQSVTSMREPANVHVPLENKIWTSMWMILQITTGCAYVNIHCAYGPHVLSHTHKQLRQDKVLTGFSLSPSGCGLKF